MTTTSSIAQLIWEQVEKVQTHPAIVDENHAITYDTLWKNVTSIVDKLKNFTPTTPIVIYGYKSIEFITLMLACLLAKKTYIPLQETQPIGRLNYIISSSGAQLCLYQVKDDQTFIPENLKIPTLSFQECLTGEEKSTVITKPEENIDDHAFTLYTSGSTGTPKGVKFSQRNLLNFILYAKKKLQLTPEDKVASFSPLHFDLSTFDIFATLISGATIYLVPEKYKIFPTSLSLWLKKNTITTIYMVPTALIALLKNEQWQKNKSDTLRIILFAGESFPLPEVITLRQLYPDAHIANLYGPTETNVCTWYDLPNAETLSSFSFLPIGSAIDNLEVYIADEEGNRLFEKNAQGELYCLGPSVSLGYLENNEKFFVEKGLRGFKTGDIVHSTEEGLVFLYRKDCQMKYMGHRIEPREIESCLRKHPDITNAAVILKDKKLCAFIEKESPENRIESSLHQLCQQYLPKIMHPQRYVFVKKLPLTSSGKIDHYKLQHEE